MLPKGYTDEKQYIILMKMETKEDNIKLPKFVCQLSKKPESIINRQKALIDSLSIISGGSRQNVDRVLSQKSPAKKLDFCPCSVKFGNFDRVPETL